MNNLPIQTYESVVQQRDALAAENTAMKSIIQSVKAMAFSNRRNAHNCGPFQMTDLCGDLIAECSVVTPEQTEREKRVLKLITDNNLSWEILFSELEEAKQRINRLYKLPDDLDFDCEFENGDYGSDEEPWLRGRVAGFNEALKVIKRSHNAEQKSTAQPVSEPYKLSDGRKLVPFDPAKEMFCFVRDWSIKGAGNDQATGCNQAMLATAPARESE